jgi:hypothetical protein
MVNKLTELKKKQEMKKRGQTKENNWSGFGTTLFQNIINILLITIIGSNLLFSIRNFGLEEYLPTDITKQPYNVQGISSPIKTFPYSKNDNPINITSKLQNWFATTIQNNWIFSRTAVKEILNNLKDLANPDIMKFSPSPTISNYYKYTINSIIFLLSPIISILLMFIVSIIGFFVSMYNGFKQSDNILNKIMGLFGGYNIGIITSLLQSVWLLGFLLIKPFVVKFNHIIDSVKEFRKLLMFLFVVSVLSASYSNLDKQINIGVTIALLVIFGYPLIKKLF